MLDIVNSIAAAFANIKMSSLNTGGITPFVPDPKASEDANAEGAAAYAAIVAATAAAEAADSEATAAALAAADAITALSVETDKIIASIAKTTSNLSPKGQKILADAAKDSTHFTDEDYVDLGDFIDQAKAKSISSLNTSVMNEVSLNAKNFVIANITNGFPRAQGAAIWIPTDSSTYSRYGDRYSRLNFDRETHWGDVAKAIANASK
jgi:hypothetical protein